MGMSADAHIVFGVDISDYKFPDEIYKDNGLDPMWEGTVELLRELAPDLDVSFYGKEFSGTVVHTQSVSATGYRRVYFDPSKLEVTDEEIEHLNEFCEMIGMDAEPRWMLCASYG